MNYARWRIIFNVITKGAILLKSIIPIFFLLSLLKPIALYADGRYYVGKDAGGVYFQTDQDGGWYIGREDLKFFKIGESGTYSIEKDVAGTYVSINKKRQFYLDIEARAKLLKETEAFNAAEEKRLRVLKENEDKRRQEAKDKETIEQGDKQAPQTVKVEIHIPKQERGELYMGPGYYPLRRAMVHPRPKDSPMPKTPPFDSRLSSPRTGNGEFPWWKGSLYPKY